MPGMKFSIPHHLTQEEAALRMKNLIGQVQSQYGDKIQNLKESWTGYTGEFRFEVMGMAVSGVLRIESSQIQLDGQIPFAAIPFKGKIEDTMRQKITELLA